MLSETAAVAVIPDGHIMPVRGTHTYPDTRAKTMHGHFHAMHWSVMMLVYVIVRSLCIYSRYQESKCLLCSCNNGKSRKWQEHDGKWNKYRLARLSSGGMPKKLNKCRIIVMR
jgi:hypothetical protein